MTQITRSIGLHAQRVQRTNQPNQPNQPNKMNNYFQFKLWTDFVVEDFFFGIVMTALFRFSLQTTSFAKEEKKKQPTTEVTDYRFSRAHKNQHPREHNQKLWVPLQLLCLISVFKISPISFCHQRVLKEKAIIMRLISNETNTTCE